MSSSLPGCSDGVAGSWDIDMSADGSVVFNLTVIEESLLFSDSSDAEQSILHNRLLPCTGAFVNF